MKTNMLDSARSLSNQDLLDRLPVLAGNERHSSVDLVAHLAALQERASLYEGLGFGSLFEYCTVVLRLSEDAACTRTAVAGACRRFPGILELLAAGATNLTNIRRLAGKLTPENHEAILARAVHRTREEIEVLLRELDPLPDLRSSVRKVPAPTGAGSPPSAPAIPDGDPGTIFDRALAVLLERVEKRKLGATAKPRRGPSIRPGTDNPVGRPSRHIPNGVKRVVSTRDSDQCAFVSATGRRCTQRAFLEFHHVQPFAHEGPATVENISFLCRRHNKYEAERLFGPYGASKAGESRATSPQPV